MLRMMFLTILKPQNFVKWPQIGERGQSLKLFPKYLKNGNKYLNTQ